MKHRWGIAYGMIGFGLGLGTAQFWPGKQDAGASMRGSERRPLVSSTRQNSDPSSGPAISKQATARPEAASSGVPFVTSAGLSIDSLVASALQLNDPALRAKAIQGIREAIASGDPETMRSGLKALMTIYDLDFDKASFLPVLKPLLESADKDLCQSAWLGVLQCGPESADLDQLRSMIRKGGLTDRASYLLFRFEKGDLTGESGEVVRDLVAKGNSQESKEAMRGIWGAKLSPDLEAQIIAVSRQPESQHDAIYFSLSTQQNKSSATVDRLIEAFGLADPNTNGRAAWGLGQGVSPTDAPKVADAALRVISSRNSGYLAQQCWDLVSRYSGPEQLADLQELEAKPNLSEERRAQLKQAIARAGARK